MADQEIREVFGNLAQNSLHSFGEALFGAENPVPGTEPPPKAPKLELTSGKRQRPSDSAGSHGSQGQGSQKGRGKGNKQQPQLQALVHAMGRLIIRQETQLQILKQNSAWTLYLKPGVSGPVSLLHQTAEKYREEAKTKFMEVPVRAILLHTVFQALMGSLQGISSSSGEAANPEGQRLAQLRGQLELSEVGRGTTSTGDRRGEDIGGSPRIDRQGRSTLGNRSGQRCHSQVQCDAFFVAGQDGNQHIPSRSGVEGSWRGDSMGHLGDDLRPFGTPGDRTSSPSREPPPWRSCQRGPEAYDCLCRLVLHNPSNQCYLNAFAYMYLWCHCRLEAPEYQLFGTKIQAWRDVLYTTQRPLTISRLPSWRSLLKGWRQPASQHDVADFMMHIIHILDPPLQATWEARWETEQGIVCQDSGRLSCPIILPLNAAHHTLQDCINDWSLQARLHALASATNIFFIQLAKYRCRGTLTFKNRQALAIPAEVTIPIFGKDLRTFKAVYSVVAIIMHHGAHTSTGHYTTILCDGRGKFWETDDGRQAQLSASLSGNACTDGYIFALMRRH